MKLAESAQSVPADWQLQVFFDGDCPLCQREIALLRRWDRRQRIWFTDIAAEDFRSEQWGRSYSELMAEMHGRLPDGSWVRGVETFRRLYAQVGFGWLVPLTRWPGVRQLLDFGYDRFARNRLRLTGRCAADGGCRVPTGSRATMTPPPSET